MHIVNVMVHYQQEGNGEPLILIPYLTADHACYAFQVPEYAKHFTCFSLDLPHGAYSVEQLADQVAAFMREAGIAKAHVSGLSLGGAVGLWLAAKYPDSVRSLSVHSGWPKTDPFVATLVRGWQIMANALGSVPEMVVLSILPLCLSPELQAAKPEYVETLANFVRSRPALSVDAFNQQSNAVIAHDVASQLGRITAPTLITFGALDSICSVRFAEPLRQGIAHSELVVFEGCAHAPLYEKVEEFNRRTVDFLRRHAEVPVPA